MLALARSGLDWHLVFQYVTTIVLTKFLSSKMFYLSIYLSLSLSLSLSINAVREPGARPPAVDTDQRTLLLACLRTHRAHTPYAHTHIPVRRLARPIDIALVAVLAFHSLIHTFSI